ncbi:MAG: serine/threonine protein kinase, partial [Myxococcales bacterium]|nr:serine/threonine protein kinase [Myxococcales bacterium]
MGSTKHSDDREVTDPAALGEGELIAGRYRPKRVLGIGGMGRVLEAEDLQSGARVALKIPFAADPDRAPATTAAQQRARERERARFVREAQTAAMLEHPNVVRVLDVVSRDDGRPVMVLELLEGETLAALLQRRGRLAPGAAATILVPVLEALHDAHRRGLVHRDFKPDNIFLARVEGRVVPKLLDFGISKALHGTLGSTVSQTSLGGIVGTPYYMAPEVVA